MWKNGEYNLLSVIIEGKRGRDELVAGVRLHQFLNILTRPEFLRGRGDREDDVARGMAL